MVMNSRGIIMLDSWNRNKFDLYNNMANKITGAYLIDYSSQLKKNKTKWLFTMNWQIDRGMMLVNLFLPHRK